MRKSTSSNPTSTFANVRPYDVVIGRGKAIREHAGNVRFYGIVSSNLQVYSHAATKAKKSLIIYKIVTDVYCEHDAKFVKLDPSTGQYQPVEDAAARTTIAQTLRDELNQDYKSSKQHKRRRRLVQKQTNTFNTCAQPHASLDISTKAMHMTAMNACSDFFSDDMSPFPMQMLSLPTTSMDGRSCVDLGDIINRAVEIIDEAQLASKVGDEGDQQEIFSSLFKAFGHSVEPHCSDSVNPFEPTPIAEEYSPNARQDAWSRGTSLDDDWEPFPIITNNPMLLPH